jgi:hypothetical protein
MDNSFFILLKQQQQQKCVENQSNQECTAKTVEQNSKTS